jgi:hypothetical protein
MRKKDGPLLDGKTGTFGNKTNKISEIRDILLSGNTLKEKKIKDKENKNKRLDE